MQQALYLIVLLHLGELFQQIPGVLRRHFSILLPFGARQVGRNIEGARDFTTASKCCRSGRCEQAMSLKTIGSWVARIQLPAMGQ